MSETEASFLADNSISEGNQIEGDDIANWIERVRKTEENGEFFRAADHAEKALALLDGHLSEEDTSLLQYYFVRAVVRSGAPNRAGELYEQFNIKDNPDVDRQALWPKILKEQATELRGRKRKEKLHAAAEAYEGIYQDSLDFYPAVNAATLYQLTGDKAKAEELAHNTLKACDAAGASYWKAATIAEASLVIGDVETAEKQLEVAANLAEPKAYSTLAATRKQIRLLCRETGQDCDILDALSLPNVVFFAGHIVAKQGERGRFPASEEAFVAKQISNFFDNHQTGFAYGSLASGSDLMIAEECIKRDIELHAVLPFKLEDFIEVSVKISGQEWVKRFEAVYSHIQKLAENDRGSITFATDGAYLGDDSLFGYCADFAMGLALVRSHSLDTDIHMLSVYDGKGGPGFGTDSNLERWNEMGLPVEVISPKGNAKPKQAIEPEKRRFPPREPRAILFGDVKGFSKLSEEMLPAFHSKFMGRLSKILKSFGKKVLYSNSWGDAVYIVFEDSLTAAICSLEFQKQIKATNFSDYNLPEDLSLRLSVHYGPVFRGKDYICNERTYYGSHVTKAARIEPITPPGEIYVTEAFAAALALTGDTNIECNYMGTLPLAKDFGQLSMYVLKLIE